MSRGTRNQGVGLTCVVIALLMSCATGADDVQSAGESESFKTYWYNGQAELTRYTLEQIRYGEIRNGDAVLIFVTEDFLPDKQVKYEGGKTGARPESVLKLNFTRKFLTGIYPYSLMTSVFTPVDAGAPETLKATCSVQEWCGHTYTQLNRRGGRYRGLLHSYFQDEADREFEIAGAFLEDEIWTRIRLDPARLPVGAVEVVPGLNDARLRHRPLKAEKAVASFESLSDDHLEVYQLEYKKFPRSLRITYESAFPHAIVAWEERDGPAGNDAGRLTTRAVKTHSIRLDYWNKNGASDTEYRSLLGLEQ